MSTIHKNRAKIWYILGGLLTLLVIAAAIKARQKPRGESVSAEKVARKTIRETVSASGKIFPETEVKISSDVSGEIVELYVKEGDSVTVGQILAKIRPDEYQSAVERGEAAVNTARSQRDISSANAESSRASMEQLRADQDRIKAQLTQVKAAHERNEKLFKEGVIAQAELESSLSNLRALESNLAGNKAAIEAAESNLSAARENIKAASYGINSAQASLKEFRTSLQKTIITAPVSGIVTQLNVEKGERVVGTLQMSGTEMMRVSKLTTMEVRVDVSENDIHKVTVGDDVDVEVDAYLGRKFLGKVTETGKSASNIGAASVLNTDQVTNFMVKIRIDPASYADLMSSRKQYPFLPGMSASVDIFTQTAENVLALPIISVTAKEEEKKKEDPESPTKREDRKGVIQEIVFVVLGDTVGVRQVKTGIQDNDYIEIRDGLQEGETVVTGPYSAIARKLSSGTRIRLEDPSEKEKKSKKKSD